MPWVWPDLDRWVSEGKMSEPAIMKHLDVRIHGCVGDDKMKEVFDSVSTTYEDENAILTESAFISLLTTKERLPSSPEGIDAGKIIYASIKYFSTLPLPRYSDGPDGTNPKLEGLDFNQLKRGLEWFFPDGHGSFITFGYMCRQRNMTDHLRLIFQSLASPTPSLPYEDEKTREIGSKNPFTVEGRIVNDDYCSRLSDSDDVILEDLLDVIWSTQDIIIANVTIANIDKDKLLPIAKQLMVEHQIASFYSLAIPIKRFESLVKALLFLQYSTPEALPDLSEFSEAASCLCAAFLRKDETGFITWPMFEHGMRVVAPYVFDSYYNLLARAFLGKTCDKFEVHDDSDSKVFIGPPNALTIPQASQLYTFLVGSIWLEKLRCFHHYTSLNLPTSSELVIAMQKVPDEAIVIISGTASGEATTFGLYLREPKSDGLSIQQHSFPDTCGSERCSLFQLSPRQDVFRGIVGKPGWKFDSDSITIGEGDGVVMVLKDDLRKLEVRHQVTGGDKTTCTYEANRVRGDWIVEFNIAEIAIWSESS
ncbi:hypothetical protein EYC80_005823 [Monilinia laxa]|uniref:TLDc domain-containing protein n=1 Tax=Monilinia laxa TaxID=61186 RepID=A0A5N6KFD4_MONLA|nr:hypothetical protein EYC80_005823 [Monilinia laxa]